MANRDLRRRVLTGLGASEAVADELLVYTQNVFSDVACLPSEVPADEDFVAAWRSYAEESEVLGGFECLKKRLVQFRFPIQEGISKTESYLAATRRGAFPVQGDGLIVSAPDLLRIEIHPTAAGHIPILFTENRADFKTLVRAFTRRNEPDSIPDSMGACMVSGYNNWDRLFAYRREWERNHPDGSWERELASLSHRKEVFQDRFILLSNGPYSGVSADAMRLPPDVWRAASHVIRREHECTHYFTRRMLGSMRNNLFDELIADYMGIVSVAGRFRADWFLRFMGLEDFPAHRSTGRFENYTTGLSEEASSVLRHLMVRAARSLESISIGGMAPNSANHLRKSIIIRSLAACTLEEIAVGELMRN